VFIFAFLFFQFGRFGPVLQDLSGKGKYAELICHLSGTEFFLEDLLSFALILNFEKFSFFLPQRKKSKQSVFFHH
jgi:hypothetical protein